LVVWPGFFPPAVVVLGVVTVGIGEVGVGIDTDAEVLVSPLESEPHPASRASSATASRAANGRLKAVGLIAADSQAFEAVRVARRSLRRLIALRLTLFT
jgi:hypothetical protein